MTLRHQRRAVSPAPGQQQIGGADLTSITTSTTGGDRADKVEASAHGPAQWLVGQPLVIVAIGIALVACAGLYHLGSKSLWLDEGFAIAVAGHTWPSVWSIAWGSQVAGNMLLYHLMQHAWLALGSSEATFRSLSVVLAVATIPPFDALARRLFGYWPAAISVPLLALNAFFIQYAQEARAYSLAVLMTVVSSWLLVRAVDRQSRASWVAYTLSAMLGLYSHYFIALVIFAHFLSLLLRRPRMPLRVLLAVYGLIAVAALPLLVAARAQGAQIGWVPPLSVGYVRGVLQSLIGSTGDPLLPISLAAIWVMGTGYVIARRRWRWEWLFATALAAVPIGTALVVSLVRPAFVARYLIVALPGLVMVTGALLAQARPRWVGILGAVALIVLTIDNLLGWYTIIPKEGWREAVAYVTSHAKPGDVLIAYPNYVRLPVDYYMQRQEASTIVKPLYPSPGWGEYFPSEDDGVTLPAAAANEDPSVRRVWLLYRYSPPDPSSADGKAIALATGNQAPVTEMSFPYVGIQLYDVGR